MISRQLGTVYPQAIANIANAAKILDGPHDRLKDYFTAYLFDPIGALGYPYQLIIVVDGLDEWRNYESFLAELVHIPSPSPVKFVLTSRFNYSIEQAVDKMPTRKYPLPLASQTVIERYFHQHLSGDINWKGRKPEDDKIHRLAARADGLLLWAAIAQLLVTIKIDTTYPHEILDQVLLAEQKVVSQKDGPEDGQLERLYRGAISTLFPPHIRGTLRKFLAATVVLQEALPIGDFAHLLGIPGPATEEIHQRLTAFQTQSDPKTNLISPATQQFHASFVEFITTESDDQTFPAINTTEAHYELAKRCLEIVFVELLPSFRGKTCTYTELRGVEPYAVKFWPQHFSSGTPRQELAPPSGTAGMDLISEQAMRHWATLFLPCIAARFQDGYKSFDGVPKSVLPYEVAVMIGKEDVTTLSYHIQCLEIATRLQPLDVGTWKALGFAYERLYEQSQSNRDLDEEITAFRHGLEPAPHPDSVESLNDIATALRTRYEQRGGSNDLHEAISLHREALLLRPAPHPDRSMLLNNLANALLTRFAQWGASNDLDEAISLHREALLLQPAPHLYRSSSLNNLAIALQARFERLGISNDLDEAISLHREVVVLQPAPHPDRSASLNNLASALQTRSELQGTSNDLDEAISLHREVILLQPAPHPDRSASLNNLINALQTRFEHQGTSSDLDEAISLHQEVLLLPTSHPGCSTSLNNPISLLIPPQNSIVIPPPSGQSYPLSLDSQNHQTQIADTTPPVVIHQQPSNASPQCSVTVLVAGDAKRHLQSNMHALERIFTDFGVQRDLWMSQVGFDEELLCRGGGYVQEVFITMLEDLEIEGDCSMIQKIGKILSPFPGVVQMPQCFFRTPVFKHDGTVWETYNDFVRDHVNTRDSFEYDSTRCLHMTSSYEVKELPVDQEEESSKEKESSKAEANSEATTSNSNSAHTTGGGNHGKKAKGKTPERTEQEESSDGSDDSHDSDPHAGTSPSPRPQIKFEIITEVKGESLRETLKIAGAFTFEVWGVLSFCQ